jgi:hypothetical protein
MMIKIRTWMRFVFVFFVKAECLVNAFRLWRDAVTLLCIAMAGSILQDCNEPAQPYAEAAFGCSGLAALATSISRKHASTTFLENTSTTF